MIDKVSEVRKILTEPELEKALEDFEEATGVLLKPLNDRLAQVPLTTEVQQLELHMTFVESWRDRVAKLLMISSSFVEHSKSTHFLLPNGKGITTTEKEAYQKKLGGGFIAIRDYLVNKLDSIDSRVMLCKKLLFNEGQGNMNKRYTV